MPQPSQLLSPASRKMLKKNNPLQTFSMPGLGPINLKAPVQRSPPVCNLL